MKASQFQRRKRVAPSRARVEKMKLAAILGCPFGGGDATVDPPAGPGAKFVSAEGKGGSITSLSVRTGFGASAGGKYSGEITCIRLPGSIGLM